MAVEFKEDKKPRKKPFVKGESVKTLKIMYKVSYYMGSGSKVGFKWFSTFGEATEFCIHHVKSGDVIEVKRYESKPENAS